MLPDDFFFQYENYVGPMPGPEIMQVAREAGKSPTLHYHSWLGRELQLTLTLDDDEFGDVVRLVTTEVPFWELPPDISGEEALIDGDWPLFTLRYQGREHVSGGACAGYWHPGIAQLQTAMRQLFEKHLLYLTPRLPLRR